MALLALLALNAILFVASALLMPRPKIPNAKPSDPNAPSSRRGVPLPVVFGTVKVAANVADVAMAYAMPVVETYDTNILPLVGEQKVTVAHDYQMIMQAVICHGPVDELVSIAIDDVRDLSKTWKQSVFTFPNWTYLDVPLASPQMPIVKPVGDGPTVLTVNAPKLFRGRKFGGGLSGEIEFYWGTEDQPHSTVLELAHSIGPGAIANYDPRFRWVCHAVFGKNNAGLIERFGFGESAQVHPIHFVVRRSPSNLGLTAGQINLDGGANPAEIIYDILTNLVWGCQVPASAIDIDTFIDAGVVLATEAFGLSITFTDQTTGDEMVSEILRYIDGQVQQSPVTGLLELTLNRDDYVDAGLFIVDESNARDMKISRPVWENLKNQIKVVWTERSGVIFKETPTQPINDIGAQLNMGGRVNADTIEFKAVTDAVLANQLAYRSLKETGRPLLNASFMTDRNAAAWKIGFPFKVSWEEFGISEKVFRVATIDYGSTEDGAISVEAIEDIFALDDPLYSQPIDAFIETVRGEGADFGVIVRPIITNTATHGTVTLDIEDPQSEIVAVRFSTKTGNAAATPFFDNVDPTAFRTSVLKDPVYPSVIAWQVVGLDELGAEYIISAGEYEFPLNTEVSVALVTDWKPVYNDPTGDTVLYTGTMVRGTGAWLYELVVQQDSASEPAIEALETPANYSADLLPDINGKISNVFVAPPEGYVRYGMIRAYLFDGVAYQTGEASGFIVFPKTAQPPVVEIDHHADGSTGTAWLKIQDRGIPWISVMVRVQIGTNAPEPAVVPMRDVGDVSVVKGGILGAEEYEHDVFLDTYRQSLVLVDITLATTEIITVVFPGFDRNRTPDFGQEPWFDGDIIRGASGDDDTVSVRIESLSRPWHWDFDTWQVQPVDVTLPDPSGNAGQVGPSTDIYRITLFSDPIADIDVNTLTEVRELQHAVGASTEPVWDHLSGIEPLIGDDVVTLNLKASAAPVGYTARLWERHQDGGGTWTTPVDITALTTPALSAIPTVQTAYTWPTGFERIAKDITQPIVSFEFKAEILDNSSDVVAYGVIYKQWYRGPF